MRRSPQPGGTDLRRPVFSRFYARVSPQMEREGMADLRDELLRPLAGRVVEVGAGNGLNFSHYPPTVNLVYAVEPEPYLRRFADAAASTVPVEVKVLRGTAEQLPLPPSTADAAVLCLVLCSVADRSAALQEVRRVLRPGGRLCFLEHCIAESPGLRFVQRLVDATVWPALVGGCHTATDPLADIAAAGFEVTAVRRLQFPEGRPSLPASPHVLGTAVAACSARSH